MTAASAPAPQRPAISTLAAIAPASSPAPVTGFGWLLAALAASGLAALVNQIAWQESLKRFLGGSEALSTMVVVLVFMVGLGFGSLVAGTRASRLRAPLRALAGLEAGLALVGLAVRAALSLPPEAYLSPLFHLARASNLPLLVWYTGCAVLLLTPACLLMGATLPVAAEACQRSLAVRSQRLLAVLFAVNTVGSVAGAVVTATYLVPYWGHRASMATSAACNLTAAIVLLAARRVVGERPGLLGPAPSRAAEEAASGGRGPIGPVVLAFLLGVASLGYELYLFRMVPLRHQPLPYTFAAVLAGFLLYWSVGAGLSSKIGRSLSSGALLCAAAIVASVLLVGRDRPMPIDGLGGMLKLIAARPVLFAPCLVFGWLFGRLTGVDARRWGLHVARISAWNTLGCALGVVGMTLVGYEVHVQLSGLVLAVLVLGSSLVADPGPWSRSRLARVAVCVLALLLLPAAHRRLERRLPGVVDRFARLSFSRNGVVAVSGDGDMYWDGLWHSRLARNGDHVGTNNWRIAVLPVISHAGPVRRTCVIGLGTGVTSATLARLGSVEVVDTYEINAGLAAILRAEPEGSLHVLSNPKVRMLWQDARTGLALRDSRYDVIVSQPLYLSQAGSGLLNSVEFLELVRSRLAPGGIFGLYSNGRPEQAFAVRQAARTVFRHQESYQGGYLLVLSQEPLRVGIEDVAARFAAGRGDPFWTEVAGSAEMGTAERVVALRDTPRLPWGDGALAPTDDRPVVQYPRVLESAVRALRLPMPLPPPRLR